MPRDRAPSFRERGGRVARLSGRLIASAARAESLSVDALHEAARRGDLNQLRRLIADGAALDSYDATTGQTALMFACVSPKAGLDVVRFLIDSGANVHAKKLPESWMEEAAIAGKQSFKPDIPPLIVAVAGAVSLDKLKLLVASGADLQARSSDGYTVAITAASAGRMDLLDYLIERGVRFDGATSYGESAVKELSRRGR